MTTIQQINKLTTLSFSTNADLLSFYQKLLPKRVGSYRLDEVGPIMSVGSEEEIAGYLEQRFYFNGVGIDMKDKIDWYAAPDGDLEWNGGFVRHGYFMYLADCYEQSQDERYAQAIVSQMLDYIHHVPPYNPEGKPYLEYKKSTWRPFEAAGRAAENWPVALAKIISSQSLTPDAFADIFVSIYEHAVFLSQHHWKTGNHACLEVAGLGVMSIFFQEFCKADDWRSYAVKFLTSMLDEQFTPDGYTREMSGAYHWVAMRNFFAFYEVARKNDMDHIFPQVYKDAIKRAALAEFYQQKPDYSLPVTNDSNLTTRHKMQLSLLRQVIGEELVDYRLSNGEHGQPPQKKSHFFPDARLAIMRSGWDSDALYASFDMGPWGTNHMNEDQLNLELSAYGRNLLVNCGRWRYTTSPGISWLSRAQYFKTTAAYNSVLCDGMSQMPGDAEGEMLIQDAFDYSKATFCSGYGTDDEAPTVSKEYGSISGKQLKAADVTHTREVFFEKTEGFFIVRDKLTCSQEHTFTQVWHMAEGALQTCESGCFSQFEDANFIMLQLNNPEMELFHGSEDPFKGWNCPSYDHLSPAPEINVSLRGSDCVVFETLLYPVRGSVHNDNLPLFQKTGTDEETIYTVSFHGKTITVSAKDSWTIL